MEDRTVEAEGWVCLFHSFSSQLPNSGIAKLARVGVGDPYGIVAELTRVGDIVPSTLSSVEIFNRTKAASQRYTSSETTKLLGSLAALEQTSVFCEKFNMTLSSGRNITFSTSDIREYPSVRMPKLSLLQYLHKLQTFWDDDLPTWDPQNICPTIGGERLAAKDWKMFFFQSWALASG
ncbi:hypothetical protein BDP27DRAFT_1437960 [Rhodocollybia butyracea]|uniref:Uncharacterized protein n=1 Tax=Rhodocollybia butyracea TaxID=206335 RepID=A0A9P5TV75_9AGAR|nr:hypothetical protein BDP27DRAFT_1437960 [Rhodocollybia butyracea]